MSMAGMVRCIVSLLDSNPTTDRPPVPECSVAAKAASFLGQEAYSLWTLASSFNKDLNRLHQGLLDSVEQQHFRYFAEQQDPDTHLTYDRSRQGAPCSTAAVGFGLTSYPVAVERGWVSRSDAASQTLTVLKTLYDAPQGDQPSGTSGTHGLFYHFLDPKTALRAGKNEVSTIDTALLMAGVLFARNYFKADNETEQQIRCYADKLYRRVDWDWAMNKANNRMTLGWTPEKGFIPSQWAGYNEAMVMMLLAMGSPTHPINKDAWKAYTVKEETKTYKDQTFIPFSPMFGHQYSHTWIDFRGIKDDINRKIGFDYFENSRRATVAQYRYARDNPGNWKGYGKWNWGLTASDGPGDSPDVPADTKAKYNFYDYHERGAPNGTDDGTIAPTAAIASLPFAPEYVLPTLYNWRLFRPELWTKYGFADGYNATAIPEKRSGWVDKETIGIDQGPILLMTENYRTDFIWDVMKRDPYLRTGLKNAGFRGGWLEQSSDISSSR